MVCTAVSRFSPTWLRGAALMASLLGASPAAYAAPKLSLANPPTPPRGAHWVPVPALTDEFGGRRLDPAKWQPRHPYWAGREPSRFAPENVSVGDGQLRLRSTPATVAGPGAVSDPQTDVWVSAACVASRAPIAGPGYYEARVKASHLPMTSSFWLQGRFSEIDVVEQIGASTVNPAQGGFMLMNTHYFADGWAHDKATPQRWRMATGAADAYHVYGVWWKDTRTLWFYCDGVKVASVTTGGAFTEPMWLFFDTEVFRWEGLPTVSALSDPARNTMHVDWVRAWRLALPSAHQRSGRPRR